VKKPRDVRHAYLMTPEQNEMGRFTIELSDTSCNPYGLSSKNARRLAAWLTEAADWLDEQNKKPTRAGKGKK
jgi:hypothetical protein